MTTNSSPKFHLRFKRNFDMRRLTWSRHDSTIAPFCSICFAHMTDDDVHLMMWNDAGDCVQFCDKCAEKYFEAVK
jgi:hypothetical protein